MGKRPFPDPEQAPPQTAQKKPDDSGRTCSYQQNETIIRIKYSRSKRFEPSSYPFPSIRQELLPRGLPTSRKFLEGERRGLGRGEGPFLKKGPLSPPQYSLPYPLTNSTKYAMTVPKRITTSIHLRSTGEMHFWNFAPKYMPSNPPRLRSRAMPQSGAMLRSG